MADEFIKIEVIGLDRLQKAMDDFPRKVQSYMGGAGSEASKLILDTEGLKKYPPATEANQPPTPYYIRGRGTQTSASYNTLSSERYGTKWTTTREGYNTIIGNAASYAPYLAGEEQAKAMGAKGWRKILDVVKERMTDITKIFQEWTNKLLRDIGL